MTETPPFVPGDRARVIAQTRNNTFGIGQLVRVLKCDTHDTTLFVVGRGAITRTALTSWINWRDAELVPPPASIVDDVDGIGAAVRDLAAQRDADRRDAEIARANPTTPAAPERVAPQGATYDGASVVAAIWAATRARARYPWEKSR